jgi:hypothetical protein
LVNAKGVEALGVCMQNFNYIDIAEQSIKALEKISQDYPDYIMKANTLPKMMNMIDFFMLSTQVIILTSFPKSNL